ncbi:MAG: M23 family metallopeptidase [Actinomycetota bacterium]|nr:M23 family metallopeptidase [Actinomycetota bacterium]
MPRLIAVSVALMVALTASPVAASTQSGDGGMPVDERFSELRPIVAAAGAAGLRSFDGLTVVEERIALTSQVLDGYRIRTDAAARTVADANRIIAEQVVDAEELRNEYAAVIDGLDDRDRDRLETEADARRGTSAMIRKVASSDWVCPVDGEMEFRDSWGEPRSGGRKHDGVDIVARSRTPLLAPEAGTVTFRWDVIGGRSFDLVTPEGDYYFGTHLRSYGTEGEVEAGEVIGYVGRTGNAVGSHLHFEYHPGGRGNSVNPFFLIDTHCR